MTSVTAQNRPHELLSNKHLELLKDGMEETGSPAVSTSARSFERYTLADAGSATRRTVDLDVTPDSEEYMARMWPTAMQKFRGLREATPEMR